MKLRRLLSCMMALLLVCSLPLTAFADTWYLDEGSITVNATGSGQTVTQGETSKNDDAPVITQKDSETSTTNTITIKAEENAAANVTIQDVNIVISDPVDAPQNHSGEAAVTIKVADGAEANVTLDGVNIDVGGTGKDGNTVCSGKAAVQITGNGDVTLELDGKNTLQGGNNRAAVEKNTTDDSGKGELTITDETGTSGSLEATGGWGGSGIGGGCLSNGSDITISGSAEVTANGGDNGAGIGGGWANSGSNITITGSAEVTATGGINASGIGGGSGSGGSGSSITITGSAEVTANGGDNGAGIGGGYCGSGSNITIEGSAEVTAKGGVSGAGIGGGYSPYGNSTDSDITVSEDAQVKAQGGNGAHWGSSSYSGAGAAIGDGGKYSGSSSDNIAGKEKTPNTVALNEGWIAKYAPGTKDLDTATPDSLTYQENGELTTSSNAVPIAKQEPTCTEDGNRAGFTCGDTQVGGQTLKATGHSMGDFYTTKEATCQDEGVERRDCKDCSYYETREISKLKHSMGDYYTTKEATCQEEGEERSDCKNCNYYETRPLKKVDHSYGDFASDNNATCTSDGTKTRKCIWCGLKDTVPDPGTMKEHSFTNYISNNDATYDSDGTKTAVCDYCDATDTIPDPGSRLVREETVQTTLYRVLGQDGKAASCKEARKDGVLTITVEADFASLTGSFSGLKALKAQGIDTIVFVTNGATSTFALSDLLAQGGDGYTLTHDGEKVTFTLSSGTDISKILK